MVIYKILMSHPIFRYDMIIHRNIKQKQESKLSKSASHFAKNVFFSCIDDRLVKSHSLFVKQIGGAFCPSMAGGGLAFISSEQSDIALKQIVAAYTINHINHVYIESHTDCGAYRLAGVTFRSLEDEIKRLEDDLEVAVSKINASLLKTGAAPGEVIVTTRIVNPGDHVLFGRSIPLLARSVLKQTN